jgi:hypothetical protein
MEGFIPDNGNAVGHQARSGLLQGLEKAAVSNVNGDGVEVRRKEKRVGR